MKLKLNTGNEPNVFSVVKELSIENKELKEILKYYADSKTYNHVICGYDTAMRIELDKGEKARNILQKYGKS